MKSKTDLGKQSHVHRRKSHKDVVKGWYPFTDEERKTYTELGYWHNLTVCDILDRNASRQPEKIAFADDEKEITWKNLQTITRRLSLHLLKLGVKYGDFFILQLPNIVEFFYLYFSLSRIGAIPVMCLPRHRKREIEAEIELHAAVGICISAKEKFGYVAMVNELSRSHKHLRVLIKVRGNPEDRWTSVEDLVTDRIEERFSTDCLESFKPDPDDICIEQLSGGTTGIPKSIPRTHNDYICTWDHFSRAMGFNDETVVLCIGPVAHNAGMACTVGPAIWTGGSSVMTNDMSCEGQWRMIEKYKVNCPKLFPVLISRWIESWNKAEDYDLDSIRITGAGGTKVRTEYVKWILDRGWDFVNIFGMAEGPIICTRHQSPVTQQLYTVGKPLISGPGMDIKLVVNNKVVRPGEIGEMKMKGAIVFKGYFRNPEENCRAFDDEGYLHSGDLMSLRSDGTYVVEGRKKDMIKRAGENVYPEPIEDLLARNIKVRAVACVGMPDLKLDERLCTFVQLREGKALSFEEMQLYLKKKEIAVYQWPERLELVKGWPLTAANKIDKKALRAWMAFTLFKERKITEEFADDYLRRDKITIRDMLSGRYKIEFLGKAEGSQNKAKPE